MKTGHVENTPPLILERPEHCVSRTQISTNALKVMYRLHRSGYVAYLVGGGVRDILLGVRPKDFDVATNARPQEIRRLFRNSRIIGRRFRLAHVFFKDEIVEVSTFRASPEPPELPDDWEEAVEEESGESPPPGPIEDPSFGTPAEDARRRDFTVNAIFYNIADFSVIDHVGGVADLERRLLRTVGEPEQRFVEDPVRMMRAVEYGVRLDLKMEPATEEAVKVRAELIADAAPARLTYELLEALRSAQSGGICGGWHRFGLFERAFPEIRTSEAELKPILAEVDVGVGSDVSFSNASLLGALFLTRYAVLFDGLLADGPRLNNTRLIEELRAMLEPSAAQMHISNRDVHLIHHGMFTLAKLHKPPERGRQVVKMARQEYFPVAWDLFTFGAGAGLFSKKVWSEWSRALARLDRDQKAAGGDQPDARPRRRRPRRRRRRRRSQT